MSEEDIKEQEKMGAYQARCQWRDEGSIHNPYDKDKQRHYFNGFMDEAEAMRTEEIQRVQAGY